jgi:hypothetical protein
MDLGYPQVRQLLWAMAGFVAAPLILLILYVRLVLKSLAEPAFQTSRLGG